MITDTPTREQEALMLAGAFLAVNNRIDAIKVLRLVVEPAPDLRTAKDFVDSAYSKLCPTVTPDSLASMFAKFRQSR